MIERRSFGRLLAVSLAALALAGPAGAADPPAGAPPATDKALAEALFRDARALLDEGKVGEACAMLAESHRIEPKPGTILNLASCREKQGWFASAWVAYNEAAAVAARAGQADREAFARAQATAMEALLSRVKLEVGEQPAGIELRLDGRAIPAAAREMAIPVDPGEHTIEAAAPGHRPWSIRVEVKAGSRLLPVQVPRLEREAAPPPPAVPPAPPPPAPRAAPPIVAPEAAADGSSRRIAGYAVGGVGVAGIVVGSIFGVRTFMKKSEGDSDCHGTSCSQRGLDLHGEASTSATISTISFAVGLAGVGAGVVLVLTAPRAKAPKGGARVWLAPAVGGGSAALWAGGAF